MNMTAPLGGDVAVTQFLRAIGLASINNYWSQQTGLININNMVSTDPNAEQKIVEGVASYGRQLGWLLEAVNVLIEKLEDTKALGQLTHDQNAQLEKVKVLKHDVDQLKASL